MRLTLSCIIYSTIWLIILSSCSNDEPIQIDSKRTDELMNRIASGELLKEIVWQGDSCYFNFENQKIAFPAESIKSFYTDKERWQSSVLLANGTVIDIPTIGNTIDRYIVNTTLNPSGYNPLSAYITVNLPALGRIKVIIQNKKNAKSKEVEHLFNSIEQKQSVLVLGLYPDYKNNVTLIYTDKEGSERARSTVSIQTDALNLKALPEIRVTKVVSEKMESGMNLVNSPGESEADTSIPYMIDADGEVRWILDWSKSTELNHIGAQCGLHRMRNGNYLTGDANNGQIVEVNVLGEIIRSWKTETLGYSYHHEITETEKGCFLITVSKNGAMLSNGNNMRVQDHIVEFDPMQGKIVRSWDLVNMLDSTRYSSTDASMPGAAYGQSQSNWVHNNGITEWGEELLGSSRFQGFFKFDRNGQIKWIASPHKNWSKSFQKYLLQPLDKNGTPISDPEILNGDKRNNDFEWSWGLHNAIPLPNNHIIVFDNGYCRHFTPRPLSPSDLYSRIVEYEVDEKNKTIRQIWQYGEERGNECYSAAMSGVQYLKETGNRLFCPAMGNKLSNGKTGGRIIEIDPENQQVVFEAELSGISMALFHRVNRLTLYPPSL